ncbi:MAG: ABC transporter substrate-binding protein [bacterium]
MRKSGVVMALVGIMAFALVVGSVVFTKAVTLELWLWSSTQIEYLKKLTPKFEAENPGIKVDIKKIGFEDLHNKLQTSFMAGVGAPDISAVEISQMGKFFKGAGVPFLDLTDLIAPHRGGMIEARLAPWTYNGKVYGMPQDMHPCTLIYRRDLFEEAGLPSDPAEVDKLVSTWKDYVEVGKKLVKDLDGDGKIDRYMTFINTTDIGYHMLMIIQRGGGMFDKEGNVILDNQISIDTLQFLLDMVDKHKIAVSQPSGAARYAAIDDGAVATVFGPDWDLGYVKKYTPKTAGKWGAVLLPAWEKGGPRTSTWGGTSYTILASSKYKQEAWKYMQYVWLRTDSGIVRWFESYQLPPLKGVLVSPEIAEPDPYFAGQKFGALNATAAYDLPAYYMTPYWAEGASYWVVAISDVFAHKKTPEQALKEAAAKLRSDMKK